MGDVTSDGDDLIEDDVHRHGGVRVHAICADDCWLGVAVVRERVAFVEFFAFAATDTIHISRDEC